MKTYFETKVRYDKMLESGMTKKTTETYLVDALSCTEAEAKAVEYATHYQLGDVEVKAVKQSAIAEIANPSEAGDKFYLAKIGLTVVDERSAKEKTTYMFVLVAADDFDKAYKTAKKRYIDESPVVDTFIASLSEANIVEVID